MSHVTQDKRVSSGKPSWHMRGAHMNESCHTYEWVVYVFRRTSVSQTRKFSWHMRGAHMNGSCLTHKWVMSHTQMSHFSHANESCLTHKWVMSHRMSAFQTRKLSWHMHGALLKHVLRLLLSWGENAHLCCMTHSYVWHDSFICVTRLTEWRRPTGCLKLQVIFRQRTTNYRSLLQKMTYKDKASYGSSPSCSNICEKSHSCVWHNSCIRASFRRALTLLCSSDTSQHVCMIWLIRMCVHTCDMTHSYVWHDSFICVEWLIHMGAVTYVYVWHDAFICVTWLAYMCDVTRSYVWRDSFICVTWLIHMCDMTHSYELYRAVLLTNSFYSGENLFSRDTIEEWDLRELVLWTELSQEAGFLSKSSNQTLWRNETWENLFSWQNSPRDFFPLKKLSLKLLRWGNQSQRVCESCHTHMGWLRLIGSLKW